AEGKEKTGVFIGAYAVNPVNGEQIPIWVADYVLMSYGTGAIMAVPAHDERDFGFARKHGLEVCPVIQPEGEGPLDGASMTEARPEYGRMVNSGPLSGTPADQAVARAIAHLEANGHGERAVSYRLRDWLISRQRYWGAPIPIVYCPEHGQVPVPEAQLPVRLPDDVEWLPTGESPLKLHPTWKQTTCPRCGRPAERDTDTMDTFMCSSWYHLRYLSPQFDRGPFDPKEYEYWMPVDCYTGGVEHATMHLIYTRFFHKACRDMGITQGPEPMIQLRNQGQILGPDGQRMSKSRGNVVDPDEEVGRHGADAVRAYLMFGYRWSDGGPWSNENIHGVVRWLKRVWNLALIPGKAGPEGSVAAAELRRTHHRTIRQVTRDLEAFEFNTVVSALMEFTNALIVAREQGLGGAPVFRQGLEDLLRVMAPVTPHIAEELWSRLGMEGSVHAQSWPAFDPAHLKTDQITLVIQINGKVRDRIEVPADIDEADARRRALESPAVQRHLGGGAPRQVVYVPGRLVNVVV
ncbi:MAG: class I tRNA ligase family protein, partial [Anaerolineales bacterium]